MDSISDIAKALGKARIARAVDRTNSAVTNAIKRGYFPAAWRPAIERLGIEEGTDVPEHFFYSVGANSLHVNKGDRVNQASQDLPSKHNSGESAA